MGPWYPQEGPREGPREVIRRQDRRSEYPMPILRVQLQIYAVIAPTHEAMSPEQSGHRPQAGEKRERKADLLQALPVLPQENLGEIPEQSHPPDPQGRTRRGRLDPGPVSPMSALRGQVQLRTKPPQSHAAMPSKIIFGSQSVIPELWALFRPLISSLLSP